MERVAVGTLWGLGGRRGLGFQDGVKVNLYLFLFRLGVLLDGNAIDLAIFALKIERVAKGKFSVGYA
jgi:hypothetical protein